MTRRRLAALAANTLVCCALLNVSPPAYAQDEFRIEVGSAAVVTITKSLAGRYPILKAHFQSGAIGFTHDGLVAVRELGGMSADLRARVEDLIAEENKERITLYREIARANGRPDWESNLRNTFADRWILRAPPGWYYRESGGKWVRKP